MKPEKFDRAVLQGPIIVFVVSLLVSGSIIGATWYFNDKMQLKHNADKQQSQAISNQYLSVDQEELLVRQYYPQFIELYNNGIIGQERRLNWIETLRAAGESIKLPGLRYKIESQRQYTPGYPLDTGSFQVFASPMKLDLDLLHEGDLLKLLNALDRQAEGTYNLSSCKLQRAAYINLADTGKGNITAECELMWFNIKKPDGSEIDLSS